MKKISGKNALGGMTMGELGEKYPKAARWLEKKFGISCFFCPMAAEEKVAEGLAVHGLSKREQKLVEEEFRKMGLPF